MNTYHKYAPNVFLAKCSEQHNKGDIIEVTTKYGKDNESIVFNLVFEKDGFFYYSIVRADGFNAQERAKRKAEKLEKAKEYHQGLKSGKYPKQHMYSLTYAKKDVNEQQKNYDLAIKLWG